MWMYNKIFMQKKDILNDLCDMLLPWGTAHRTPRVEEPEPVFETHDIHDTLSVKEELE